MDFILNDLTIHPFSTPHDAANPCGFNIHNGSKRLSIATDLGHMNNEIITYNKETLNNMKRAIAEDLQELYRIFPEKYSESNAMKFLDNALMKLTEEYDGTDNQYIDFWVLSCLSANLLVSLTFGDESVVNGIIVSE